MYTRSGIPVLDSLFDFDSFGAVTLRLLGRIYTHSAVWVLMTTCENSFFLRYQRGAAESVILIAKGMEVEGTELRWKGMSSWRR